MVQKGSRLLTGDARECLCERIESQKSDMKTSGESGFGGFP